MKYYLGIDPGDNTGYSFVDENWKIVEAGTLDSRGDIKASAKYLLDLFFNYTGKGEDVVCIIEEFILSAHLAREVAVRDPHLVTAGMRHILAYNLPENKVVMQSPNMKSGCPDEELKRLHLWQGNATVERHAHDSLRHIVVYRRHLENIEKIERKAESTISAAYSEVIKFGVLVMDR